MSNKITNLSLFNLNLVTINFYNYFLSFLIPLISMINHELVNAINQNVLNYIRNNGKKN